MYKAVKKHKCKYLYCESRPYYILNKSCILHFLFIFILVIAKISLAENGHENDF